MAKEMKLKLEDLEVQSFVTSLDDEVKMHFRGGEVGSATCDSMCCEESQYTCPDHTQCCGGGGGTCGGDTLVQPTGAGDGCTGMNLC